MSCGLSKFSYQKCQTQPFNHRFVISSNYNLLISQFSTPNSLFAVPPDDPIIRNQNGQELSTYEIGPYEVGQNLILDCQVSGGKKDYWQSPINLESCKRTTDQCQTPKGTKPWWQKRLWPMHIVKKTRPAFEFSWEFRIISPTTLHHPLKLHYTLKQKDSQTSFSIDKM